ncbi:Hypothetical_protein [Hexamita inflata]|uniref:Hypothetical_protein n=1 Tax=Hexamita inflata TaxID=28002 RepID=A0AA86RJ69_9EUKA|nr:Hypothetical protein HINF_LOCUS65232 [Hexamita inflata]
MSYDPDFDIYCSAANELLLEAEDMVKTSNLTRINDKIKEIECEIALAENETTIFSNKQQILASPIVYNLNTRVTRLKQQIRQIQEEIIQDENVHQQKALRALLEDTYDAMYRKFW